MTVRELVALLSGCNPESLLVWEARSEAFLVIGIRPGMHQTWSDPEPLCLTLRDREFLGSLHVRDQ